jgi:hypothetical protein
MLIVVHWVLLTWVIVNCSAHVGDRNRHRKFLKEIGLEKVSGLTTLHTIFHGLTIRLKYDDLNVVVLHKGVWRITLVI